MATISHSRSCRRHHESALLSKGAVGIIAVMKSPILSFAIILTLSLGALNAVYADSATWSTNPTNGDWNTAANWTPNTVPNGPNDIATFSFSNQTSVSNSSVTEVNSIVFSADASPFAITLDSTSQLTISGVGVVSNSGATQNVANTTDDAGNASVLRFTGNATAGDSTITYTNEGARLLNPPPIPGALIEFENNSTAGTAEFINLDAIDDFGFGGLIKFTETSSAANGTFTNGGSNGGVYATVEFHDQATAGTGTFTNQPGGGRVQFFDSTTADHATFVNKPAFLSAVYFFDNSTAANATIINEGGTAYTLNGFTYFLGNSTAGEGTFIVNGSLTTFFGEGRLSFWDTTTAGTGTFIANGGQVSGANGGGIYLNHYSSADHGTFIANGGMVSGALGGRVYFTIFNSTGATATLIANGGVGSGEGEGGGIVFHYSSTGGEARVEVFANGFLDVRGRDIPELTIGSLEGDGLVFLGNVNLSVGSNSLSTVFSGLIEENSEGVQGALTKIGTGILMLTSANTYTGGTTIEGGKLVVNNRTGSGTGSGAVQVNAGILAGRGTIAGTVIVGTGSGSGAALAPGRRGAKADTLTIQGALSFQLDSTYKFELKSSTAAADKVVANGVTINGALFSFTDLGASTLTPGIVFTLISNTAATPISGAFSNLADGSIFTASGNNFRVSYEGGDGNDLTLTVVP